MRETDQGLKRDQDLEIGHIQDLEIGHTQDLETDPVPDHMIQDLINLDLVLQRSPDLEVLTARLKVLSRPIIMTLITS